MDLPKNEAENQSEDNIKYADLKQKATKISTEIPAILKLGSLIFKDERNTNIREEVPHVRVKYDVNVEDLIKVVMEDHWKMKIPKIVVLIVSNVAQLKEWPNQRQMKNFQKGIMKAADTTNMWIITNGVNIGVTPLIGEAVRNEISTIKCSRNKSDSLISSKFNVIGVTPEDKLRYSDALASDASYRIDVSNDNSSSDDGKYELNSDLTHYIVIKEELSFKNGVNKFLNNIMNFIAKISKEDPQHSNKSDIRNIEIPVVALVIQGGYESSNLVLDQIKNRIPVVVFRGSGGLADLLAYVEYEVSQRSIDGWDLEFVNSFIKPELKTRIGFHFPKLKDNVLLSNEFSERILDCVKLSRQKGRVYLTVLNIHNSFSCNLNNLTEYLLMALFKSQRSSTAFSDKKGEEFKTSGELLTKDLYLCLDWNCPEVAKKEVLVKDPSYVLNLEKKMFEEALTRPNRNDFVDLFLSHGFKLRAFITAMRLRKLFRKIHNNDFFRNVCWEGVLANNSDAKQSDKFIYHELNWLIEACIGLRNYIVEEELDLQAMGMMARSEAESERKAIVVMTMWAMFTFRKKLVKILWKHCDQPIHLAIVIAMTYDKLAFYVSENELNAELKNEAKMFVNYAYCVLDECYKDSPERAQEVLNELTKIWDYKSPVDMAAFAKLRYFLSHPCCQKWLTTTYYGNISVREVRCGFVRVPTFIKILLSAFLVFPMYLWIRFKHYSNPEKVTQEEEGAAEDEDDEEVMTDDKVKKLESNAVIASMDRDIIIRNQPLPWIMMYEMWNSPITKFWTFQLFYIIYLSVFSIAILYPGCGSYTLDVIVCVWNLLIIADLIRRTYYYHLKYSNLSIRFKVLEISLLSILLFVYVFGRLLKGHRFTFLTPYLMKVTLCFALLYAYYRLFAIYLPISATLGPLLYRLKIMILVDFVNFMRMTVVVMVSFGIVIQTVLYPDQPLGIAVFIKAFRRTFFTLFVTPLDELVLNNDCDFHLREKPSTFSSGVCYASRYNDNSCANTGFWPYLFSIGYFILLKLILMTLLYAIFASSASSLASDTDSIWKFQRYILVMDFVNRLPLPPPLNIFIYIYFGLRWLFRLLTCYALKKKQNTGINMLLMMDEEELKHQNKALSPHDYMFMKQLATNFYEEQTNKVNDETILRKQWEILLTNTEEIEYEKKILRHLKGKVSEIERTVRASLVILESMKKT